MLTCSRSKGSLYSFELSASIAERASSFFFKAILLDFRNKPGEAVVALYWLLPKSPIVDGDSSLSESWLIEGGGLCGNAGGWSAKENVKVVQLLRETLSKSKLFVLLELEKKLESASLSPGGLISFKDLTLKRFWKKKPIGEGLLGELLERFALSALASSNELFSDLLLGLKYNKNTINKLQ